MFIFSEIASGDGGEEGRGEEQKRLHRIAQRFRKGGEDGTDAREVGQKTLSNTTTSRG